MKHARLGAALAAAAIVAASWVAWTLKKAPHESAPRPTTEETPATTTAPSPSAAPSAVPASQTMSPVATKATQQMSEREFDELAAKTLSELPTAEDLRKSLREEDNEHDAYPEALMRVGRPLGRIAQAVHDQPSLKPRATEFYVKCTLDEAV